MSDVLIADLREENRQLERDELLLARQRLNRIAQLSDVPSSPIRSNDYHLRLFREIRAIAEDNDNGIS